MSYARTGILVALIFAIGISIYFFYNLIESNQGIQSAVEYFEDGEYKDAVLELNQDRDQMTSAQYQLYLAYITRGRNDIIGSSALLAKAEEVADSKKQPEVLMEIYLNQALNGFIELDGQSIDEALEKAKKLTSVNQDWVSLFEGIKDYLKLQCSQAEKNWQKPVPHIYFSPFMEAVFSKQFTSAWLKGHMARCEIESGNYLNIRQGLENGPKTDMNEFNFLTGMTYLKEASEKSAQGAIPYYKIAFNYLSKVPMDDPRYAPDRQQIMNEISQRAMQLIQSNSLQDLGFYTDILEKGKATNELNQISLSMSQELDKEISDNNWKQVETIVDLLSHSIGKGEMRDKLRQRFEMLLNKALDNGDFSHVEFYWKTIRSFADDSNQLSDQFADLAAAKILVMIPYDDNKLSISEPYFVFWKAVEKDHAKRLQFADDLALMAHQLWNMNQEAKAITVMQAAYAIPAPADQKAFYNRLEDMMESLWRSAAAADAIDQYPYFLQAVNQFGFTQVNVLDPREAAQQLVDAQYMFDHQRFEEAKKRAQWVLQVDPRNQQAKKIAGLADFYFGNYSNALENLKGLPNEPEVAKAMAISELLTGNKGQEAVLKQLDADGNLNPSDYLRIGYGLLLINQPQASLQWFNKYPNERNSAVIAGQLYASYELKNYEAVIDEFQKLDSPWNRLDGIQGIVIDSLIAQGKNDAAEELLLNMLKKGQQPGTNDFPLFFQAFKDQKLDRINRYLTAAKFYSEIRKNPQRAIIFYRQIINPTPEVQLRYVRDLEDNGNYQEAYTILQNLSQTKDLPLEMKKEVYLDLANTYQSLRYWIQSADYYQKYLQLVPGDTKQRLEYAKVLASLLRYDLAYQQLQASKENDPLFQIDLLIRLGKNDEATKAAQDWLKANPSLQDQLELARLFSNVPSSTIPADILKQIKDPNKLTIEQKEILIDLWVDLGDYVRAQELARNNKSLLQKRATGLLALAHLASKITTNDEAMDYAQKASVMYPKNTEIKEFIEENALPVGAVAYEPDNPSKLLANAKGLLRYAEALLAAKKLSELHTSLAVQQASNWLSELSKNYPQLPEVLYYYGVALLQSKRYVDAETALNNAIRINPTYAEAYEALAEVFKGQNDLNKAADNARQALKLNPRMSSAWETLGTIHEQQGTLLDAIQEYQNAIHFQPNDVSALVKFGKLRLKTGDPEEALSSFEKALNYSPHDVNLLKLIIVTLNNSDLRLDRSNKQLKARQQELFNRLKDIDPKEAEAVQSDLIK